MVLKVIVNLSSGLKDGNRVFLQTITPSRHRILQYILCYLEVMAVKVLNLVLLDLIACKLADSWAPLLGILVP